MKKMKCDSCGGVLTPDDNNEYAYCEYCGSKYKMKEDININITTPNITRNPKMVIPIVIMVFVIFGFTTFMIIKNFTFESDKVTTQFDVKSFNSKFELYNGTQSKFFVEKLLEDIVTSNKTEDNKILVIYNDKETEEPKEITDIKHSLKEGDYEVSFEYNEKAFISKVYLEIIE